MGTESARQTMAPTMNEVCAAPQGGRANIDDHDTQQDHFRVIPEPGHERCQADHEYVGMPTTQINILEAIEAPCADHHPGKAQNQGEPEDGCDGGTVHHGEEKGRGGEEMHYGGDRASS